MQTLIHRASLGKGSLALAALVTAIVIGLSSGAISQSTLAQAASWTADLTVAASCQNEADVLAAADRSRNGISLSCNQVTLSQARAGQ